MKRRADEDGIARLGGAVLLRQNGEWQLQHRYIQIERMAAIAAPQIEEAAPPQLKLKVF